MITGWFNQFFLKTLKKQCLVVFCGGVFFALLAAPSTATAQDNAQKKLEQLRQQVSSLRQKMLDTRSRYGQLQNELQRLEQEIGALAKTLTESEKQLEAKHQTLDALQKRQQVQEQQLNLQRETLAKQIRAAYAIGRQDYLKILLNQEDPAKLGRVLTYYDYFNRARAAQIEQIHLILERIHALQTNIAEEKTALQALISQQTQQKQEVEKHYQERQVVLSDLAAALKTQENELTKLQEDKRHLASLLGLLKETSENLPDLPEDTPGFAKLKGKLSPPVAGEILHHYGSARGVGSLKWQGVVIAAQAGEPVRSVAAGRVVFADWLRNFGQLIILDHDQGYMSLYGYNQSLYKKTGEQVKDGEIIATAGESGGQQIPALYFEIRQQGNPVNPVVWLRKE